MEAELLRPAGRRAVGVERADEVKDADVGKMDPAAFGAVEVDNRVAARAGRIAVGNGHKDKAIRTGAAGQRVGARPAGQLVDPGSADQRVIAVVAAKEIIAV